MDHVYDESPLKGMICVMRIIDVVLHLKKIRINCLLNFNCLALNLEAIKKRIFKNLITDLSQSTKLDYSTLSSELVRKPVL